MRLNKKNVKLMVAARKRELPKKMGEELIELKKEFDAGNVSDEIKKDLKDHPLFLEEDDGSITKIIFTPKHFENIATAHFDMKYGKIGLLLMLVIFATKSDKEFIELLKVFDIKNSISEFGIYVM